MRGKCASANVSSENFARHHNSCLDKAPPATHDRSPKWESALITVLGLRPREPDVTLALCRSGSPRASGASPR